MENNLITAEDVIVIAFSDEDQISTSAIPFHKIEAAELRFIEPHLNDLYPALREGRYKEFTYEHIKPALAYFVKYSIIAELMIKIGDNGITKNKNINSNIASANDFDIIRAETRNMAVSLMKKAISYLDKNAEAFPEYDLQKSIGKRITINGGLII